MMSIDVPTPSIHEDCSLCLMLIQQLNQELVAGFWREASETCLDLEIHMNPPEEDDE